MALDLSIFASDLIGIESDLAQTVTIGGTSYAAIVSDQVSGKDWQLSGYMPENSIEVCIRSSLGASVSAGTLVTYNGTVYRVIAHEPDAFGAGIRLMCEGRAK
jgi:hypothetical protein